MSFAPVYLLNRFFFRLSDFFHHWYIDGSRAFGKGFISFLEKLDQSLALRITIYYFTRPLYGDYTVIGRILGVIFRSGRILVALLVYIFIFLAALSLYLVWLSIPFLPLILAYQNYVQ